MKSFSKFAQNNIGFAFQSHNYLINFLNVANFKGYLKSRKERKMLEAVGPSQMVWTTTTVADYDKIQKLYLRRTYRKPDTKTTFGYGFYIQET